jgi:hypothetical protein
MGHYLLIGSRDPFDSNDVQNLYDLASGLTRQGNEVTPRRRPRQASGLETAVKGVIIIEIWYRR